jgi:ATP/maltotriose-dependent transcriptional regulator MalT
MAMEGLSNHEIAKNMNVSENTIKSEFRIIYDKIKIKNRNEFL